MADIPIRTFDTEIYVDAETGDTVREIEHFRQGDTFYRIVHENGETRIEHGDELT